MSEKKLTNIWSVKNEKKYQLNQFPKCDKENEKML
jgi:hypothetical protein